MDVLVLFQLMAQMPRSIHDRVSRSSQSKYSKSGLVPFSQTSLANLYFAMSSGRCSSLLVSRNALRPLACIDRVAVTCCKLCFYGAVTPTFLSWQTVLESCLSCLSEYHAACTVCTACSLQTTVHMAADFVNIFMLPAQGCSEKCQPQQMQCALLLSF